MDPFHVINSINIISRSKSKNINEITLLNIGARTKVNKTFKQTNRIKRTKREKRDKRGETWRASIDRRSSATLRPSVTFYESSPSPNGSSFHHVSSTTFVRNVRQSECPV